MKQQDRTNRSHWQHMNDNRVTSYIFFLPFRLYGIWSHGQPECIYISINVKITHNFLSISISQLCLIYISTFFTNVFLKPPFQFQLIYKEMLHQAIFLKEKKTLTLIHCFLQSFVKNQTNNLWSFKTGLYLNYMRYINLLYKRGKCKNWVVIHDHHNTL